MQKNDKKCLILYTYLVNEALLSKPFRLTWEKKKQDPSHPVLSDQLYDGEFILCLRTVL